MSKQFIVVQRRNSLFWFPGIKGEEDIKKLTELLLKKLKKEPPCLKIYNTDHGTLMRIKSKISSVILHHLTYNSVVPQLYFKGDSFIKELGLNLQDIREKKRSLVKGSIKNTSSKEGSFKEGNSKKGSFNEGSFEEVIVRGKNSKLWLDLQAVIGRKKKRSILKECSKESSKDGSILKECSKECSKDGSFKEGSFKKWSFKEGNIKEGSIK